MQRVGHRAIGGLVAFDLDGVLYSSENFLGEAYREAIANVNGQRPGSFARVPTTREILDHTGWPVSVILQRLFPHIDAEAIRLLHVESLTAICSRVERGEGRLYPDVPDTLLGLQRAGYTMAIASNGRARYVEAVLHTYDLAEHFASLLTADEAGDKTAILRIYLERHRGAVSHTVMVGDRASDVDAARAVGCHFVGCDYGHGYRHEIEAAGPVVSRFRDLPRAIAAVLGAGAPAPPAGGSV